MNFAVGDILRVDGDTYEVIGAIAYRNRVDNSMWMEYRMYSNALRCEKWLSYDEEYREYSISQVSHTGEVPMDDYHEVDSGVEEVIQAFGNVDVEIGDCANFVEFEDYTEEKIISWETWDDGKEISTGYYLDENEIVKVSSHEAGQHNHGQYGTTQGGGAWNSGGSYNKPKKKGMKIVLWLVAIFVIFSDLFMSMFSGVLDTIGGGSTIAKYLDKTRTYVYETSITGTKDQKADVYQTNYSVDEATRDIINGIDGKTEDVQQNTEDDTVAILTSKEYCLIYTSEDGETLVQVSTREYAYYNDDDPYRASRHTRSYYRSYYYSRGYSSDSYSYSSDTSPYSNYSGAYVAGDSYSDYNTYSDSVRQSSTSSRTSSGGGTSSGK